MPKLQKNKLRQDFRRKRASLDDQSRAAASGRITESLNKLEAYEKAKSVAAFWPLSEEVDIRAFISGALTSGRSVLLPRVNRGRKRLEFCVFTGDLSELTPGPFGILEPRIPEAPLSDIDLVIVPSLAFDLHRHRLGYGAGYYDRVLKQVEAKTVGVAFDIQTIDILPTEEHDVAVDMVITENRVF